MIDKNEALVEIILISRLILSNSAWVVYMFLWDWSWWGELGDELAVVLSSVPVPPTQVLMRRAGRRAGGCSVRCTCSSDTGADEESWERSWRVLCPRLWARVEARTGKEGLLKAPSPCTLHSTRPAVTLCDTGITKLMQRIKKRWVPSFPQTFHS